MSADLLGLENQPRGGNGIHQVSMKPVHANGAGVLVEPVEPDSIAAERTSPRPTGLFAGNLRPSPA